MKNTVLIWILLLQASVVYGFCNAEFTYNLGANQQQICFVNQSQAGSKIMQFYWDFGDGQVSLDVNPVHTYSSPGRYQVYLTLITPASCINVKNREVYVGINEYPGLCTFAISAQTHNATQPDYNNGWILVSPDAPFSVFSVSWSNGSNDAYIDNLVPGVYCVTLSDINGCYATDCYEVGYNNNCIASILIDSLTYHHIPGCFRFVNNSHGEYSQLRWDFGDGNTSSQDNPIHIFDEPGEYVVWLYFESHYGCSDSTSRLVRVPEVVPLLNIEGVVHVGDNLLPTGKAVLYEKNNNRYDAIGLTSISNGTFHFENLDIRKQFIIHTIPWFDINEVYFPKYLATYFSDSIVWQQAKLINFPIDTLIHINLSVSEEVYYGSAKLFGLVFRSANATYENSIFGNIWYDTSSEFSDDRAANMVVFLLDNTRRPLNSTLTRNNGYYEFRDLVPGTYYIRIEKPGLASQELMVIITADGDFRVPDLIIHSTTIQTGNNNLHLEKEPSIYPNPANDFLFVENALGLKISVYSASGVKLLEFIADSPKKVIDVSTLPGNGFTVVVEGESGVFSKKIIKN